MGNLRNARRERSREYLKPNEVDQLLAVAKTTSRNAQRDYALLLLMYRHGLRVSEVTALKVADVDLEGGTVFVRRLKSGDSNLHPLHNGEGAAVRGWLLERAKLNPPESCDTLFISERRQALSRRTVWVMIGQLAKAAGLAHLSIHPHMMRHACGFSLVNRSVRPQNHSVLSRTSSDRIDNEVHRVGRRTFRKIVLRFALQSSAS